MNSSAKPASASPTPTVQDRRQLPLFFRRPELLEAGKHGDLQLADQWDYSFAADTLAIPLTVAEFREAAVNFPIVFGGGDNPMPVALTSLQPERNLFVSDGRWQPGTYVPAYVRRYPFLAVKVREKPDD